MAIEKIVVQYEVETDKAKAEFNDLANTIVRGEQKIKESSKDTTEAIVKNQQTAAQKRERFIKEEIQDLNELRQRRKQAYTVKEIDAYNKRIAETKKRVDTLKTASGKLKKETSLLSGVFKQVGVAIAAAFTVDRVINFTKESVRLAAQASTVKRAFDALNTGTLLNRAREAVNGTVSDLKLMQNILKANEFGIGLENIPKFFEFAKIQADKLGVSVDFLVNSIIDGIGRKSTLVLDNLGISATELQAEFKKTGDFAQAVGNIIDESMTNAGESVDNTKDSLDRFNASLDNFKVKFGEAVAPVAADFADQWTNILKILTSNLSVLEKIAALPLTTERLQEVVDSLDSATGFAPSTASQRLANFKDELSSFTEVEQFTAKIEFLTRSIKEFNDAGKDASELELLLNLTRVSLEQFNTTTTETTETVEDLGDAIDEVGKEAAGGRSRISLLTEELNKLREIAVGTGKELGSIDENFTVDLPSIGPEQATEAEGIDGLDLLRQGADLFNTFVQIGETLADKRNEQRLRELEEERKFAEQRIAIENGVLQQQLANGEISNEEFISLKQQQVDELNKLDRERESVQREARRKAAIADKAAALFDIAINSAIAISKVTAQTGVAAPATIPLILAQTLASAALVAARPIPEFATGVVDLQGPGTETSDSISAKLSKGESVLQASVTKQYKPEITALHKGYFPELLEAKYIAPAIEESRKKNDNSFSNNLANSIAYQISKTNIDDAAIIHAVRRNKTVKIGNASELATEISRQSAKRKYMTNGI